MGATMGKNNTSFLDALPTQTSYHVVMLGLDSAGKTTALYRLKLDQYLNAVPTIGFNCEKVQGTIGKAKGIQFLIWDVGGQEKLRPLWRSYTRCTDGILFVVDSVDVERMEEAKMELMRTAKCPDNQGVPVLILANKQDLPGAQEPKQLEKILGLYELKNSITELRSKSSDQKIVGNKNISENYKNISPCTQSTKNTTKFSLSSSSANFCFAKLHESNRNSCNIQSKMEDVQTKAESLEKNESFKFIEITTPASPKSLHCSNSYQDRTFYIQPACAITGEGLQEGLEVLYEMIIKRRKFFKACKRKP